MGSKTFYGDGLIELHNDARMCLVDLNYFVETMVYTVNSALVSLVGIVVASWLIRSFPDRVVRVRV